MRSQKQSQMIFSFLILAVSLLYYFFPSRPTRLLKDYLVQTSVPTQPAIIVSTPQSGIDQMARVARVIDGDTIVIEGGQKVRYIGIDAPEIHNPKKAMQCFGTKAAQKNEELVLGKQVRLVKDVSNVDRYGRLLRYVYVGASTSGELFVNAELVRGGFASAATFPPDVAHSGEFNALEQVAREQRVGFWLSCQSEK